MHSLIALILSLSFVANASHDIRSTPTNPVLITKRHVLNLDLPAKERWNHLLNDHNTEYTYRAIHALMNTYLPSKAVIPILRDAAVTLLEFMSQPYADELRGISEYSGIPLGDVVLGNIVYDISAFNRTNFNFNNILSAFGSSGLLGSLGIGGNLVKTGSTILRSLTSGSASSLLSGLSNLKVCTSIVAMDKSNKIIHGRNMDYATVHDYLKPVTIEVDFQRNGKTIFTGTTFIGFVGVTTGIRPGAYTVSGDQRNTGKIRQNLQSFFAGGEMAFFQLRNVLEEENSYNSALDKLVAIRTVSPVYYIIGGIQPGEGSIVVRSQSEAIAVVTIPQNGWYVVETNYDPWQTPPAVDDRRDAAIQHLNTIGKNHINPKRLFDVLSAPPVLNNDTIYTVLMSAVDSKYSTIVRYDAHKML